MNLSPFNRIHPCGETDRMITQMQHYLPGISLQAVEHRLIELFKKNFQYTATTITSTPWQEDIISYDRL